jgi:hypothetical protein
LTTYLKGKKFPQCGPISSFSNGNASLRISSLNAVGGYDLRYALGAEDEDLASRIIGKFGKNALHFDSNLIVFHKSDDLLSSFMRRSFKYGRSAALRFKLEGGLPTVMPIPAILIPIFILELTLIERISLQVTFLTLVIIPLLYLLRSQSIRYWIPDSYFLFLSESTHLIGLIIFLLQRAKKLNPERSSK